MSRRSIRALAAQSDVTATNDPHDPVDGRIPKPLDSIHRERRLFEQPVDRPLMTLCLLEFSGGTEVVVLDDIGRVQARDRAVPPTSAVRDTLIEVLTAEDR